MVLAPLHGNGCDDMKVAMNSFVSSFTLVSSLSEIHMTITKMFFNLSSDV